LKLFQGNRMESVIAFNQFNGFIEICAGYRVPYGLFYWANKISLCILVICESTSICLIMEKGLGKVG
jgi:hypothetical protein